MPIISASAAAAELQNASMLLISLATEPMPISPQCTTSPLNDFSSGSWASNVAVSPPTMMTMVPSLARAVPPETGASSMAMPFACMPSAQRRAVAGALVDRSIYVVPGLAFAAMPCGPSATSSTMRGSGNEVITTSHPAATSATDLPAVAPSSVHAFTASGLRSNTTTSWLVFLMMLRHMGPPMLPTPMNPTFMSRLLGFPPGADDFIATTGRQTGRTGQCSPQWHAGSTLAAGQRKVHAVPGVGQRAVNLWCRCMDDIAHSNPPAALPAILDRTTALAFPMPSEPRTGAMLRVLAASKPGGRLLELGTGTGLSTAWLLDGMDRDATLVSVDIDPVPQAVARDILGADPRLEIVTEDAVSFLRRQSGAPFDLLFADAMPGKYELLDEALALLRPGGLYVIDDMLPQASWPPGHAAKVPLLIAELAARKAYRIVSLAWASGLIIVARVH